MYSKKTERHRRDTGESGDLCMRAIRTHEDVLNEYDRKWPGHRRIRNRERARLIFLKLQRERERRSDDDDALMYC